MSDETFSRVLREAMAGHGLDEACELALKVGMEESTLSEYLSGERLPSESDSTRICAVLPGFDDRLQAARDRFKLGAAPDELESMRAARDEAVTQLRSSAESMRQVAEVFESIPDGRGRLGARGAATIEALLAGLEATDAAGAEFSPETPIHPLALAAKRMVETAAEDAPAPDRELKALRAVLRAAMHELPRPIRAHLASAYSAAEGRWLSDEDFQLDEAHPAKKAAAETVGVVAKILQMLREAKESRVRLDHLLAAWGGALAGLVAQEAAKREERGADATADGA